MKMNENFKFKKIFFVGVGGISMSGLCKISSFLGAEVLGSDISNNEETDKLEAIGIKIFHKHDYNNVPSDTTLLVFSGAISNSNPELRFARDHNIQVMERSEYLGQIDKLFNNVIAVSGTHGKTTTTAMIAYILYKAGYNPTIHLGGESVNLQDNTIIGGNEILVVEACEYRESFKFLRPQSLIITNIEADHLDYYHNLKEIVSAFTRLKNKSKFLIRPSDVNVTSKNELVINKDFEIKETKFVDNGYQFVVYLNNSYYDTFRLNMLGKHNINNAMYAIALCHHLGLSKDKIKDGLSTFLGVKRRYERIGMVNNVPIIIDYAHHPTEIKNSIAGVEEVYNNPLIVFQPHTYSRTKSLMNDFTNVLSNKNCIIYPTYPAREEEIAGGTALDLYDKIMRNNTINSSDKLLIYVDQIDSVLQKINKLLQSGSFDCVLILGAGNLADNLRKYYK